MFSSLPRFPGCADSAYEPQEPDRDELAQFTLAILAMAIAAAIVLLPILSSTWSLPLPM